MANKAADTRLFKPLPANGHDGDLFGLATGATMNVPRNFFEFLIEPVKRTKAESKDLWRPVTRPRKKKPC
jgi:hypothetical protein